MKRYGNYKKKRSYIYNIRKKSDIIELNILQREMKYKYIVSKSYIYQYQIQGYYIYQKELWKRKL